MSGCAIVTGAQRNIGAAIAVRLALAGMPVDINYPNEDAATRSLAHELGPKGVRGNAASA